MIKECLSAAGITTVVWIDDFFASPSRDASAEAIHKHAERLKEQNLTRIELPAFAPVDLTKSKNEIGDAIDDVIETLSDQEVAAAEKALAASTGTTITDSVPQRDLTTEEFQALQRALGTALRTFSLGRWTSSGAAEFASAGDNVLFLVDKEFNREPGDIDGTKLLVDIITRTQAFCVMLTHTCTEAGQDDVRGEISTSQQLPKYRFTVLSKQQGSGILAAWATFNTRAALQHDFAHVEAEPPAAPAEPGGASTPPLQTPPPPAATANPEPSAPAPVETAPAGAAAAPAPKSELQTSEPKPDAKP